MRRLRRPLFLAPAGYRQRRRGDAARLLPVLGAFLVAMPLFWPGAGPSDAPSGQTERDGLYLFAVWLGLILAAALLARGLAKGDDTAQSEGDKPADDGG